MVCFFVLGQNSFFVLQAVQIVALLQGLFLIFVLFKHRNDYKKVDFWLLLGCIVSVLLYALGDDDFNLFLGDANWFFFHDILLITFFSLFVKNYRSGSDDFNAKYLIYFLPYATSISLSFFVADHIFFKVAAGVVNLIFVGMLCYSIYIIIKNKKDAWLLYFAIALTIIFVLDELSFFIKNENILRILDGYAIILSAIFLFYFVLYKLIMAPKEVLPKSQGIGYKSSTLTNVAKLQIQEGLHLLMIKEKWFKNQKLSVDEVAKELGVPRQHVSEVLNTHMNMGFQEYINQFRVDEFITCIQNEAYKKYTLLAIAQEVGFSSKTSFNNTFKKLKGMTPSQYKKSLQGI